MSMALGSAPSAQRRRSVRRASRGRHGGGGGGGVRQRVARVRASREVSRSGGGSFGESEGAGGKRNEGDNAASARGGRGGGGGGVVDRNLVQTQLRAAVLREDYEEAVRLRDLLKRGENGVAVNGASESAAATTASVNSIIMDSLGSAGWPQLGIQDWLVDRLDSMDLPLPTAIQSSATRAVLASADCCICSATGSGKTLALAVPMLSLLTFSLFEVETLVRNGASSLLRPIAMIVVPSRELGAQMALLLYRLLGGSTVSAAPGSKLNMFKYNGPKNVRVIGLLSERDVMNARENCLLEGVQFVVAMPQFAAAAIEDESLDPVYLRFIGVDEVDLCLTKHEDAMEKVLGAKSATGVGGQITVFSGASMNESQVMGAIAKGWLEQPLLVTEDSICAIAPRTIDADVVEEGSGSVSPSASGDNDGTDDDAGTSGRAAVTQPFVPGIMSACSVPGIEVDRFTPSVPPGIQHKLIKAPVGMEMLMLARLLQSDREKLRAREDRALTPMRSIVFMSDEGAIRHVSHRLRNLIWNKFVLELLLPDSGYDSLAAAEHFTKGSADLLITTMVAARGLDFPAVTNVYSLGTPGEGSGSAAISAAKDYLHRAGRIGRTGSYVDCGIVTTIVSSDAEVEKMMDVAAELGIEMEVVDPSFLMEQPKASSSSSSSSQDGGEDGEERTRLQLEDLFQLVESSPDANRLERLFEMDVGATDMDGGSSSSSSSSITDSSIEDDEDDDDTTPAS